MATKHEEITHALNEAGEDDIEIVHLTGEIIIHIKTVPKQASSRQGKGKWAKVADEFSKRAPLLGMSEPHADTPEDMARWKHALNEAEGLWKDRENTEEEMKAIRKELDRSFSDQDDRATPS
jgi:hypothetical protein